MRRSGGQGTQFDDVQGVSWPGAVVGGSPAMWANLRRRARAAVLATVGTPPETAHAGLLCPEILVMGGWLPIALLRANPDRAISIIRRRLAPLVGAACERFDLDRIPLGASVRLTGRVISVPDSDALSVADPFGRHFRVNLTHALFIDGDRRMTVGDIIDVVGFLDRVVDPTGEAAPRRTPILTVLKPSFADHSTATAPPMSVLVARIGPGPVDVT